MKGEDARERIQKLLVTGDNRLKQGVDPAKARESWEQALAVAVEAGLEGMEAGGDFADGVIAFEGYWLGAEEFASFDKKAVSLLQSQGKRAHLLS